MVNYFPPTSVYPKNYDSNYNLFLVYNTSETITVSENMPWADEIDIKPVSSDAIEIWATNGFANIDGELFYYDAVEYDIFGKINKFKRCARNLGGTHTKHNLAGAEVRGFVIAEHHNQIVDAIINIEKFVGYNFTTDQSTLDWRIRNLQQLPAIFDDFTCPNISFDFYIISDDPATGIVAQYSITIDGVFATYNLDFGDGQSTTTSTKGTHTYAPNSTIDPIVTVSNTNCTMVQSPIQRTIASQPKTPTISPFEIPIPVLPNIPVPVIPNIPTVSNIPAYPPIVFPCVELPQIGPVNIPSIVMITPIPDIPSLIQFGTIPVIPSTIVFGPTPIVSQIRFGPTPIVSQI